ncbi:SPFH domain-containing protein [Paenibacillus barengoltzii]|uniref:SPFH domain-containing protein n=1 Tax=Paenibacillus barengoltzii TaxID=343517 RepID=UPI000A086BC5|nr:SPFH domain-containing protein [Paenibacillus barengoltzii]MEC2346300.1 SPFH domain-containing protein [Paenibacillus barengoltzii]SMF60846.1 Regulator of protease activity HflC, stomatin/prohibitin superfamily [Paenibacillus barengoltzii]
MKEKEISCLNGFVALLFMFGFIALGGFLVTLSDVVPVVGGVLSFVIAFVLLTGLTIVQPNQAAVITFFGRYLGVIRKSGFYLAVPFSTRKKVSLRVRNFNSAKLKVNDVKGNPIEIATVVVFSVVDSAKALFEVDEYETFVEIQSEAALRHVASKYPYDQLDDSETGFSLRANTEEIALELTSELQNRLAIAGVKVIESRLTHLAYSTEIASAMLQRQQAEAIIAAREKIVDGAVTMVQMAIERLQAGQVVELDDERKAAMINNLLVAVVSDRSAQPVINTSTLY